MTSGKWYAEPLETGEECWTECVQYASRVVLVTAPEQENESR